MTRIAVIFCWVLLLVTFTTGADRTAPHNSRYPKCVTRYDLATRDELRYARWLRPLIAEKDSSKWMWPKDFVKAVGTWATSFADSRRILEATLDGCPVDGQPALTPLDRVVDDCATILGVPKPVTVVRNDPYTRAYLVAVGDKTHLVLTSSLLNLYENQADQLRFIVGRELGRVKTEQLELRRVTYGLLVLLQSIDDQSIPETAKAALMTYGIGRFLTWSREAEISADRAGLLCCGSCETAYAAMLKLLHGLKEDSAWRDPTGPGFDAEKIIDQFEKWEKATIISTLNYFRKQSPHTPFLVERLAALKQFVDSGQYHAILDRGNENETKIVTTLSSVDLYGLADKSQGVHAYIKCFVGDKLVITSPTAPYGGVAYFKGFTTTLSESLGEPIFIEIWDDRNTYDKLLGGCVIYPNEPAAEKQEGQNRYQQKHIARILWDWKDRSQTTREGVAHVTLRVIPFPKDG